MYQVFDSQNHLVTNKPIDYTMRACSLSNSLAQAVPLCNFYLRTICVGLALLVGGSPAFSQAAYDGNGVNGSGSVTLNVPMGTNRVVVVYAATFGTATATFNGQAMTSSVTTGGGSWNGQSTIFVLPLGTGAAVSGPVVVSTGLASHFWAGSFQHVDQSTPVSSTGTNNALGLTSTVNVTSVSTNDIVLDGISNANTAVDATFADGGTDLLSVFFSSGGAHADARLRPAAGAAETLTWTLTGGPARAHVGVVLQGICADLLPPVINTCPVTVTDTVDAACNVIVPDFSDLVTVTEDCGPVSWSQQITGSGTDLSPGSTLATNAPETINMSLIATDATNKADTCMFDWILEDTMPPLITTCPPDAMLEGCDSTDVVNATGGLPYAELTTVITYAQFMAAGGAATENCGDVVSANYLDASSGTCPTVVTRTFVVFDASGLTDTCMQTITIDDTTPPTFSSFPGIHTVEGCNELDITNGGFTALPYSPMITVITTAQFVAEGAVGFTEACPHRIEYIDAVVSANPCTTRVRRSYEIVDSCGNNRVFAQFFDIVDTSPPSWEISDGTNVLVDSNAATAIPMVIDIGDIECDSVVDYTAIGTDLCDGTVIAMGAVVLDQLSTNATYPSVVSAVTDDGAGNYTWSVRWGLGATSFTMTMMDSCGNTSALTIQGNGVDTEPPFWMIKDSMLATIVDNDPLTAEPTAMDLGMLPIDLCLCGHEAAYSAMGIDSCIGIIDQPGAVSVVSIASGSVHSPTTATVTDDGTGNYTIEIFWGVGTSTVTLAMADISGNADNLSLTATVVDPLAGNILPNAKHISPSLDMNGDVSIQVKEIAANVSCSDPVDVLIETGSGLRVFFGSQMIRSDFIAFNACAYRGQKLKATIIGQGGTAWSYLTIKDAGVPTIGPGRSKDVYCFDPLVAGGHIGDTLPSAFVPCGGPLTVELAADWPEVRNCGPAFDRANDTLKVIYREYEVFDKEGNRASVFDTITVFRLPAIDVTSTSTQNAYCAEQDTTYCGVGGLGPYMIYPERCTPGVLPGDFDGDGSDCDTLYFLVYDTAVQRMVPNPFFEDAKCDLLVHLDYVDFGSDGCQARSKYILEVKQTCVAAPNTDCMIDPSLIASNGFTEVADGYFSCEYWLLDLDTVAPVVDCKDDNLLLTTVYTSAHECAAHIYVPPVEVSDDWTGIKTVKAIVEGIGTLVLSYNVDKKCYESHTQIKLAHKELPYKVIYEAVDSCHNVGVDSCYIRVKDNTKPVAVVDKGVTVSLSDKKVWVDAATFDEGSWDNCEVNFLLARRSDWYEACIDLCDTPLDTCWISEHHDTLWQTHLETDKHVDEVEAHYAKTLEWLCEDGVPCGDLLYNAWQYDLMKYATLHCREHPYEVDAHHFDGLVRDAIGDISFASKWKNPSNLFIGSSTVDNLSPFTQNDAYYVDMGGNATRVLDTFSVRGATTDYDSKRILIVGNGDETVGNDNGRMLYALPFGGVQPVLLGEIQGSGPLEGLAYRDGKLYASDQFVGIFEVDLETLEATLILPSGRSLGGLDTDPITGTIYGSDDLNRKIVEIDVENGTMTEIADYPVGEMDLDGLAVGNAKIFLVDDNPGVIHVYSIENGTYESSIPSPFGNEDWQSGGAAFMPMLEELVDEWSQIGGGWSDAVPFSCEDACGPVTVEVLVMDYWCNWATAWTKVWVEDKTPVEVVKDVVDDETITCKVYKDSRYAYPDELHPVSIEYIVEQAKAGEQDAYDALDDIFGGYCKAWRDPYGNYVDAEGTEIDCDITFYDSVCKCTSYYDEVRVYDEHLGYLWVDSLITKCDYYQDTLDFQKGIVVVNCEENVYCEQDVWCEIDHCGQGYIFRKFKIWQGCPDSLYEAHDVPDSLRHPVDTIYRHQRIWVGNECPLSKYMFDVPEDTEVVTCDIEYGADGNVIGTAGPENTGYAKYKFDDDCRIVGIGHSDKVFKIVGGEAACYKILRTWYFADWCGYGEPLDGQWWRNRELVIDTCVQKIIVRDTTPPTCTIIGPVDNGGTVEVGACYFDLEAGVVANDACGVIRYYWQLKDLNDPDTTRVVDHGYGALAGEIDEGFNISSADLPHGSYKLVVTVQDDCANESYCEYLFDVASVKKPAVVCISTLAARLTPWDSDQDGVVDSAHAVIWAEEFNSSSEPACTDTLLEYRLELVDGEDDDTWEEDTTYLELFCDDVGTHMARLWVISWPSGSVDYCNVLLLVRSDLTGCTTVSGEPGTVSQVDHMRDVAEPASRQGLNAGKSASPGIGGRPLDKGITPTGYLLEQNRPNPFRQETTIGFVLPEAMQATLTVYDVTGRVLRSFTGDYAKGYQTVELHKSNLGGHSILYYRLETRDFSATRKMILIN